MERGAGGVAFATFYEDGEAATPGVPVSRIDEEADRGILEGFEEQVIAPLLGQVRQELGEQLFASDSKCKGPDALAPGPSFNRLSEIRSYSAS